MNKLQKAIAVTAVVQCASAMLHARTVEAWEEGRQPHQELKEPSLLERDQRRFMRDEVVLRKLVRHHTDKHRIAEVQSRVRRDLRDIVDDRGRPDNGALDDSSNVATRHTKRDLS